MGPDSVAAALDTVEQKMENVYHKPRFKPNKQNITLD